MSFRSSPAGKTPSRKTASRKTRGFSAWRGVRWTFLAIMVLFFGLMLKKPAMVAQPLPADTVKEQGEQFQAKWDDLEQAHQRGNAAEERFSADEINAALESPGNISFAGDVATGQFIANLHGKDVYVTLSGRLGAADGYLTFDPAELRIGDLPVPVSIVKPQLQSRMLEPETRAKLKLPEYVSDLRVENGQLVVLEK